MVFDMYTDLMRYVPKRLHKIHKAYPMKFGSVSDIKVEQILKWPVMKQNIPVTSESYLTGLLNTQQI